MSDLLFHNLEAQLRNAAREAIQKQVNDRMVSRMSAIKAELGGFMKGVFNETEVARCLRGEGSTDLAAEFGLTDAQAYGLAEGMANLLAKSVRVFPGDSNMLISVQALPNDFSEFLNLPGASYVSQPSNLTIPVMKWMLMDPSIDFAGAKYDIMYADWAGSTVEEAKNWGNDKASKSAKHKLNKLADSFTSRSRSGRAIMVRVARLKALNLPHHEGGYILPAIVRGHAGQNFIEYAICQPDVAKGMLGIVMSIVEE